MLFQLSKHLKIVWFSFQWYRKHHQAHTVFYHYCVRALTLLSLFWDSVRVMSYSWLCSFKTIQEEKFYMDKKEVQDNLKEILVLKMNCLFHNNCSSSLLPSSSLIKPFMLYLTSELLGISDPAVEIVSGPLHSSPKEHWKRDSHKHIPFFKMLLNVKMVWSLKVWNYEQVKDGKQYS